MSSPIRRLLAPLSFLLTLTACGVDSTPSELTDDVGTISPLPIGPEAATVEVFAESAFFGDSLKIQVQPLGKSYGSRNIGPSELSKKNLMNRISSARIKCGTRAATVVFGDAANNDRGDQYTKGNRIWLECSPGGSMSVNFHDRKAYPSQEIMGDKVTSFLVHTHVVNRFGLEISQIVARKWDEQIKTMSMPNASVAEKVKLTYIDSNNFEISQKFNIKHLLYPGSPTGYVTYNVFMKLGFSPQGSDFRTVELVPSFKSAKGFSATCDSRIASELGKAAKDALPQLTAAFKTATQPLGSQVMFYMTGTEFPDLFYLNMGR